MTDMNRDPLLDELSGLLDEVPPMPEDLHGSWMQLVEEEAMNMNETPKPARNRRITRTLTQLLAVAAALVFVVGGTILTRDDLSPKQSRVSNEAPMYKTSSNANTAARSAGAGDGMVLYSMAETTSYDAEEAMDMAESAAMAETPAGANSGMPAKVIRTASLTLYTKEYDQVYATLRDLCTGAGGWISYSSSSTSYNGLRTAWMTLRIPAEHLDSFLAGTEGVARVSNRSESADDVTESYYDTATRLATKQALLDRLLAMATDAASLSDLLDLETKIADVQYDIDRLQGSLNHTDSQVNYATVDLSLHEEAPADAMQVRDKSLGERMLSALTAGWESFTDFLGDMVVFVMAALPFIVVIAVVIVAVCVVRKKTRRK